MAKLLKFKDEYIREVEEAKEKVRKRLELLNSKDWIPLNHFGCPDYIFMEGNLVLQLEGSYGIKEVKMYSHADGPGKRKEFYQLKTAEGKATRIRLESLQEELGRFYVTKEEVQTKEVEDE